MLIQTEINEIDNILNVNKNGLIIAFSKSDEEKKNFILNIASNMAIKYNKSIAVLNSSISFRKFINECIRIQYENISKVDLKDDLREFKNRLKNVTNSNILINFASSYNINELIEKCRYVKSNQNVELIVIDKIDTITEFKEMQADIFSKLKKLAVELKVCIVCVC